MAQIWELHGKLTIGGSHYWESMESPLKRCLLGLLEAQPSNTDLLTEADIPRENQHDSGTSTI